MLPETGYFQQERDEERPPDEGAGNDEITEHDEEGGNADEPGGGAPRRPQPAAGPYRGTVLPPAATPQRQQAPGYSGPRFFDPSGEGTVDAEGNVTFPHSAQQGYQRQMQALYSQLPQGLKQQFLLSQLKLSHAEGLRLQKLQNAAAQIKADQNLTEEEKAHALTMLQTGINPLALREAQAKAIHAQLQNQQMQEQYKGMQANEQMVAELNAKGMAKRIAVEPHPGGNERHLYFNYKTGKIEELEGKDRSAEMKAQHAQELAKAKAEQQTQLAESKEQRADATQFHKVYTEVAREIDKKLQLGPQTGGIHGEYYEKNNPGRSAREDNIEKELKARGFDTDVDAYVERRAKARAAKTQPAAPGAQPAPDTRPPPTDLRGKAEAAVDAGLASDKRGQQQALPIKAQLEHRRRLTQLGAAEMEATGFADNAARSKIQRVQAIVQSNPDPAKLDDATKAELAELMQGIPTKYFKGQ